MKKTPLLKASYGGHYHVVQYLLSKNADIHHKDKDGWTALHNACSRGSLPIVRKLLQFGSQVNVQNKTGHTPLINAASKGHVSVVEYLLDEAGANPLIKNNFQEAAYDVSAASGEAGEAYICEMLQKAEEKEWKARQDEPKYDLFDFHITVMVILHENQRSSSLLGLSRPHFSPNSISKNDRRGPWSHHPSGVPTSKDQVMLPSAPGDGGGSNWFWLTDWHIDYSDPRVDPTSGWQYARSFGDNDEKWTPVAPTGGYGWVRRRRWVRVMKRRMDLARGRPVEDHTRVDYLEQAETLVRHIKDEQHRNDDVNEATDVLELTREVRVYEEAVQVLLAGMKNDSNQHRKHQASVLVSSYSQKADRLNGLIAVAGTKLSTPVTSRPENTELARELGLLRDRNSGDEQPPFGDSSSAEGAAEFDTNPWSRDSGAAGSRSTWYIAQESRPVMGVQESSIAEAETQIQEDDNASGPRTFIWEPDAEGKTCRRCERRFNLLSRRHHCRRCGLIVCDKCSSSRTYLNPSDILQDPNGPFESLQVLASQHHRVCDKCYADLGR
ncbi:hypothetical protein BX666DRAFT_1922474, partial [Dichotomocladium elegans]